MKRLLLVFLLLYAGAALAQSCSDANMVLTGATTSCSAALPHSSWYPYPLTETRT
jgi:hypothetical protein